MRIYLRVRRGDEDADSQLLAVNYADAVAYRHRDGHAHGPSTTNGNAVPDSHCDTDRPDRDPDAYHQFHRDAHHDRDADEYVHKYGHPRRSADRDLTMLRRGCMRIGVIVCARAERSGSEGYRCVAVAAAAGLAVPSPRPLTAIAECDDRHHRLQYLRSTLPA